MFVKIESESAEGTWDRVPGSSWVAAVMFYLGDLSRNLLSHTKLTLECCGAVTVILAGGRRLRLTRVA